MALDNSPSAATARKPLKDITNLAINAVHSLSTLEDANRSGYVKKSNAGRFKKGSAHPRSKPIDPTGHLVRLKETPHAKAARRREEAVTRHNRHAERRARANDPPPTPLPPTPSILRCHTPSPIDPSSHLAPTPPTSPERRKRQKLPRLRYRYCGCCAVPRALIQFVGDQEECKYCTGNAAEDEVKLQWCMKGSHEVLASELKGKTTCPAHLPRRKISSVKEIDLETFKHRVADKLLYEPALCDFDWNLTVNFHKKLDRVTRAICEVCQEERFDSDVQACKDVATCQSCRKDLSENKVGLYSAANLMDPEAVPSHLPGLSIAEELLIARVHVLMSYSRVKGVQYKYSGHIINFMQNTPKVVRRLPSLPQELQILHLKPSSSDLKNSAVQREYDRRFNVKRQNVQVWLEYLIDNHPDYQHMSIDFNRLSLLPENASVMEEIPFVTADPPEIDISSSQDSGTLLLLSV